MANIAEEISALRREPGGDIIAWGGARFAQELSRQGLVDEYRLVINPVALGNGLPLFKDLSEPIDLLLVEAKTFATGAALPTLPTGGVAPYCHAMSERRKPWASRFQESRRSIAPRGMCCSHGRSPCAGRWRRWRSSDARYLPVASSRRTMCSRARGLTGRAADILLSELFAPGRDTLLIYSYMFPRHREDDRPGPTARRDCGAGATGRPVPVLYLIAGPVGRRRAARHPAGQPRHRSPGTAVTSADVRSRARLAPPQVRLLPRQHLQWRRDGGLNADGVPMPMLNVFHRDGVTIRHFWGSELMYAPAEPALRTHAISGRWSPSGTCSTSLLKAAQQSGTTAAQLSMLPVTPFTF